MGAIRRPPVREFSRAAYRSTGEKARSRATSLSGVYPVSRSTGEMARSRATSLSGVYPVCRSTEANQGKNAEFVRSDSHLWFCPSLRKANLRKFTEVTEASLDLRKERRSQSLRLPVGANQSRSKRASTVGRSGVRPSAIALGAPTRARGVRLARERGSSVFAFTYAYGSRSPPSARARARLLGPCFKTGRMEPRLGLTARADAILTSGLRFRYASLRPVQRRPRREHSGPRKVDEALARRERDGISRLLT